MKCFYHSADLDGHCSGAIVKYKFPECEMYPINYGDEFPWDEIKPGEDVYMVDFCLQPFKDMAQLNQKCALHWIDHHKSALDTAFNACFLAHGQSLDTAKAACELTWEYLFHDRPVPLAAKLLSLYDSWTYQGHELEDMVLPFQMRMRMEDLDPKDWEDCSEEWENLFLGRGHTIYDFIDEGRLLLRYDEAQKAKYAKTYAFETALDNQWKPIETAPKDGTWILTITKNRLGKWTQPNPMRWTGTAWVSSISGFNAYYAPILFIPMPKLPKE